MKNAAVVITCTALLLAGSAFAAEPRNAHPAERDLAAGVFLAVPLLPATFASVLTLASPVPEAKAAASTPQMKMVELPDDGMILVARVGLTGEMETSCVSTPEAGENFAQGARPVVVREQH
jgi:hypothetical protein